MRSSQRERYADRIDRVLAYLSRSEAGQAPQLTELAAVAGMSEYHFHRIFRLMTGETVGEVVRRSRLARTLPALDSQASVTSAMAASGYGSHQSFTRAMKTQTGAPPTQVRASGAELERIAAVLKTSPAERDAPLRIEITSLKPFRLLAIRNVGDYAELNGAYQRLFDLVLQQVSPEALQGIYGVPHDDPRFVPAADCRFDCALVIGAEGQADEMLKELRLGGGEYLRLRHLGDYDGLHGRIDEAYAAAILLEDREIGNGSLFIHYLDDPEEVEEADLRSDIYLPLG